MRYGLHALLAYANQDTFNLDDEEKTQILDAFSQMLGVDVRKANLMEIDEAFENKFGGYAYVNNIQTLRNGINSMIRFLMYPKSKT